MFARYYHHILGVFVSQDINIQDGFPSFTNSTSVQRIIAWQMAIPHSSLLSQVLYFPLSTTLSPYGLITRNPSLLGAAARLNDYSIR